jgi:hypothetical protein
MVGVTLPATPSVRSQKSIGFSILGVGDTSGAQLGVRSVALLHAAKIYHFFEICKFFAIKKMRFLEEKRVSD